MPGKGKIIVPIMCIAIISLTTGCLSTTQKGAVIGAGAGTATGTMVGTFTGNTAMGAALGAGAGAVGGALVGNHLDKKREDQEKAERYRQIELEKQKCSDKERKYARGHSNKRMPKIPPGHMPPPGKCRLWYSGRPPGHQPPPFDCDEFEGRVPPGAWLISG